MACQAEEGTPCGVFVPCEEGHQWCLYFMSRKIRLRCSDCAWCAATCASSAEISMTCYSKLPYHGDSVALCYPCITKFLSENCGQNVPESQRYPSPCVGTACVEAVRAIMSHRAGQTQLLPFTRSEFQIAIKNAYGILPSPTLSRAASPVPMELPRGVVLPGPPGVVTPGSEPTLAEIRVEMYNLETAIVTQVQEVANQVQESTEKICKMIAEVHQRQEKLEIKMSLLEEQLAKENTSASSWTYWKR